VLKKGSPAFSPSLPAGRTVAIERLGFGRLEKVALLFDRPFWREAGAPHLLVFPKEASEPMTWLLGQDAFGGGPVLVAEIFHSATHHISGKDPADAADWVLETLARGAAGAFPRPRRRSFPRPARRRARLRRRPPPHHPALQAAERRPGGRGGGNRAPRR